MIQVTSVVTDIRTSACAILYSVQLDTCDVVMDSVSGTQKCAMGWTTVAIARTRVRVYAEQVHVHRQKPK